jgi:hypothetical protein
MGLGPSGQPGPTSVSTAAAGEALGLTAPVLVHLSLGATFRESLSASPMDMDVCADLILGWDWISSNDLRLLYADGQVRYRSGPLCCSWTSSRLASARRRARCRSSATGSFACYCGSSRPSPLRGRGRYRRRRRCRCRPAPRPVGRGRSTRTTRSSLPSRRQPCRWPAPGAARAGHRPPAVSGASPTEWRCSRTARS